MPKRGKQEPKNKKSKNKTKNTFYILAFIAVGILITIVVGKSFAELLENDVKVAPNSELTYYLNVSYDGVDKNGQKSSDTSISEIQSGYLYIEDKIPEGLTFDGFVTTKDGSIGAVKRSDGLTCVGRVIDDTNEESVDTGVWNSDHTEYTYHGLHYNTNTNKVTFAVKNLKAGCELTVGIKTITPMTVDDPETEEKETRRDFYNYASAIEKDLFINSNTVHAYMGNDKATLYNVNYQYTGDVPANAPQLPSGASYAAGTKVGIVQDIKLEGYTFSGWTTTDATLVGGLFTMPSNDVILTGSFTKIETNKVRYQLSGPTPPGYVVPLEKDYYPKTMVEVDSLKSGEIFNGYRFKGWTTTDVTISDDNDFEMPKKDVVLTGSFEEVTYKVTYQFYDTVLPPNADSYLPDEKSYKPGTTVTLEEINSEPTGYKFLGWYKEDEFEMPDSNIIIYGEWKRQNGTFAPTITKEIENSKEGYHVGEIVNFKITVTNTANFPIKDVIISEENDNTNFVAKDNYTVSSEHIATIAQIPAHGVVELYATYRVLETDKGQITNVAYIKGALADNYYELEDKEYKATAKFNIQSKLKICKIVSGPALPNTFQFQITGTTNQYETWITIEKDECETIFINKGSYKINEITPQEYKIKEISGAITNNNETLVVEEGNDYEITYTNEFKRKGFLHSFGRVVNKIMQGGK